MQRYEKLTTWDHALALAARLKEMRRCSERLMSLRRGEALALVGPPVVVRPIFHSQKARAQHGQSQRYVEPQAGDLR